MILKVFTKCKDRIHLLIFILTLFSIAFSFSESKASFDENTRRYLTGPELLWSLEQVLPKSTYVLELMENECHILNEKNFADLGVSSPALGQPLSPNPHSGTVQWVQACVDIYFKADVLKTASWSTLLGFFGQNFWQRMRMDSRFSSLFENEDRWSLVDAKLEETLKQLLWSELSTEQQQNVVQGVIRSILGPDELILDYGFTTPEALALIMLKHLNSNKSLKFYESIQVLVTNLILREEYLSY